MDLVQTLALSGALAAVAGLCGWRGAAPFNPMKPRLVPWRLLMVLFFGGALIVLVHLVNLLGVKTGGSSGL